MPQPLIGVDLTNTPADSDAAKFQRDGFKVGQLYADEDGNEWMFVHAAGAITQYAAVAIDSAFEAAMLTHALGISECRLGAAQVAFADNDYGWVLISGQGQVLGLTSCAADVQLYTSGTAGHVDDADITGSRPIVGIRLNAAVGGGGAAAAACTLDRPTCISVFDSTT